MRVNRVQTKENKFDVLKAGLVGGAVGYASKWVLPLDNETLGEIFTEHKLKDININAKHARMLAITKSSNQLEGVKANLSGAAKDVFEKSMEIINDDELNANQVSKKIKEGINSLQDNGIKSKLSNVLNSITRAGRIEASKDMFISKMAKKNEVRPALFYVAIGAMALMSAAIVKSSLSKVSAKKERDEDIKPEKNVYTMSDILLESMSTPCELLISEQYHKSKNGAK